MKLTDLFPPVQRTGAPIVGSTEQTLDGSALNVSGGYGLEGGGVDLNRLGQLLALQRAQRGSQPGSGGGLGRRSLAVAPAPVDPGRDARVAAQATRFRQVGPPLRPTAPGSIYYTGMRSIPEEYLAAHPELRPQTAGFAGGGERRGAEEQAQALAAPATAPASSMYDLPVWARGLKDSTGAPIIM